MDIYERMSRANAEAQVAFRAMLDARTVADPDAAETKAYTAAERQLDALIEDLRSEAIRADIAALVEALDPVTRAKAFEDAGDHFVGRP